MALQVQLSVARDEPSRRPDNPSVAASQVCFGRAGPGELT
jgi:hypothetical protein